jgi:hypothetical protein
MQFVKDVLGSCLKLGDLAMDTMAVGLNAVGGFVGEHFEFVSGLNSKINFWVSFNTLTDTGIGAFIIKKCISLF